MIDPAKKIHPLAETDHSRVLQISCHFC